MASSGIQVSCRVRQADPGSWSSCVVVDRSARRIVVAHPSPSVVNPAESITSLTAVDIESLNAGTAYSSFDGVYSGNSTQQALFESIGRPFVADLLAGYNCTIIAYGQTGSGKTYTTVGGGSTETRGLVPRAMEAILEEMSRIDLAQYDVSLTASFVEVYQERLRDLLLPNSARPLRLREDNNHDVCVKGASEIAISTWADGMAILARGNAQRSTGSTLMNADSSRSHSVLILKFTKKQLATGIKVKSKMCIVDLAGSEKVQKTAATGVRMEEAKHINRSLSALGNVIYALTDGKAKHIPYRDSKLTRLLQNSLGGNAKTHLLLTCSPSSLHMEETLSTLRFGSRAKNIKNAPHINSENAGAATEYSEMLAMMQNKIESLHSYIRQLETSRCASCSSHGAVIDIDYNFREAHGEPELTTNDVTTPERSKCMAKQAEADLESVTNSIGDDLVRAEMNSLRKALASMVRDHEAQDHAHHVARTMMEVTEHHLDSRHRSQEQTIHHQNVELKDAFVAISQLEKKIERLEENDREMKAEIHRLSGQQKQQQAGESAEAEILRRQLEIADRLAKQLQAKLTATRQEHEGLMLDLKSRLLSKDRELGALRHEMEAFRSKEISTAIPIVAPAALPSPNRVPQTRPAVTADLKSFAVSRSDAKNSTTSSNNIQSWWAGSDDNAPARNQDEISTDWARSSKSEREAAIANDCRNVILPRTDDGANRMCLTASSATRPFRARLVGLLNSLEEEATAYRNLAVETKERVITSSGDRPRRQLPCLESSPSTP